MNILHSLGASLLSAFLILAQRVTFPLLLLGVGLVLVVQPCEGGSSVFNNIGSLNTARAGHTAKLLPNGKVLVAGGFSTFSGSLASAELYAGPPTPTRLRVGTGDNAMIGGFVITGTQPKTVIVRGIGPSLPLPGALADPVIEVHGSSGELLATNDNWRDDPNQQYVIDSGIAPTNDLESALFGVTSCHVPTM